jgi:type I restriction enzyme S subunit
MKLLPVGWCKTTLGELVQIQTGKLDSNAAVEGGMYPFFTCSPITLSIDQYAFDDEAVLLGGNNAGGVFPVKHYKGKFNAYQRTYVLTASNKELLHLRFIYYYLSWILSDLKKLSVGSATKFLTLQILQPLKIALPPIDEQRCIAAILDRADAVRRKRQEAIALTEELLRSTFLEMFGDPVTNPKGWDILPISAISSRITKGESPK